MASPRILIASLSLSAAALVGLVGYEGYRDTAYIPIPGDVPTIGFGTTDGVRMGDRTTPVKALGRALADVQKYEGAIKQCVTVPLYQYEYDAYTSLAYNIGSARFCSSTLVERLNQELYGEACAHIEDFVCGPATQATRAQPGARCYSTKKPMRVIRGLQSRRAEERAMCEGR